MWYKSSCMVLCLCWESDKHSVTELVQILKRYSCLNMRQNIKYMIKNNALASFSGNKKFQPVDT